MDVRSCKPVVINIGQAALYFTPQAGCTPQSTGTLLQVFSGATEVARYAMHGVDQKGILFYVDGAINSTEKQYTYKIMECSNVVATGTLIVQPSCKQFGSGSPTTRCCGV